MILVKSQEYRDHAESVALKFILFLLSFKALEVLLFAFPILKYLDFSISVLGHKINQMEVEAV